MPIPADLPGGARLLPSADVLTPYVATRPLVHLLWLLRADPAREAADVVAPLATAGVRVEWGGRVESLLIGPDPAFWTHAVFAAAPAAALSAAAARAEAAPAVAAAALWLVDVQTIPAPVRWLFRMLRPIGRLLERDPRDAVRHRPAAMDESDINPSQARLEQLASDARGGRTTMINFLSFRQQAHYGDSPSAGGGSGRAAYRRYGLVAARSVAMVGGSMAHLGRLRGPLLEVDGLATTGPWDDLAIVHYPAPSSIVKLEAMPGYPAAVRHRTAALTRSTIVVAR